jgi:hypothetical protein
MKFLTTAILAIGAFAVPVHATSALAGEQIDGHHYQATFRLACVDNVCGVDVPVASNYYRLIISTYMCEVHADANVTLRSARFQVVVPTGVAAVQAFVAPNLEAATQGVYVMVYAAAPIYVTAPNKGRFVLRFSQPPNNGLCSVIGDLY